MVISSAHTPAPPSESLAGTLAIAGRTAPIAVLITLATTGTIAVIAILVFARTHWVLALPFALLAKFGAWGLEEQGRAALPRMQFAHLTSTQRYILDGILHTLGVLMIIAGAVASTVLILAVTFYLAGAAPVL
jgi:hypothetical protein